jgi:hypothetical protein
MVGGPVGACQNLCAKADAQNEFTCEGHIKHEGGKCGKVGVNGVGQGRLFSAKHRQRVDTGRVRQGLPGKWAMDINLGAAFVHGDTDLPVVCNTCVFDNRRTQGSAERV